MSSTDDTTKYFIRIRGRILGPYTVKQLNTLRVRGQFSQSNEISTDSQTWKSAATLDELFGTAAKKLKKTSADNVDTTHRDSGNHADSKTAHSADAIWYYSTNNNQQGPAELADLQQMLQLGELTLTDLVWKEGMSEWTPASNIDELNQDVGQRLRRRKKTGKTTENVVTPVAEPLPKHFLDSLLTELRSVIDESFLSNVGKGSIELGRYALYVAIFVNATFFFYAATKYKSLDYWLVGAGFAIFALMLQYTAVKSCGAINRLIQSTSLRMSSTAFLDSIVIVLILGGIVALVSQALVGIRQDMLISMIIGGAVFFLCEQLAVMLLHPKALGITISERASLGEEAVAILTFFFMLPLRFVPAVFALGVLLPIFGTLLSFYLLANETPEALEFGIATKGAMGFAILTLICAAFPFMMYVYFVFVYLVIDIIRSIVVMPGKIDDLTRKTQISIEADRDSNDVSDLVGFDITTN